MSLTWLPLQCAGVGFVRVPPDFMRDSLFFLRDSLSNVRGFPHLCAIIVLCAFPRILCTIPSTFCALLCRMCAVSQIYVRASGLCAIRNFVRTPSFLDVLHPIYCTASPRLPNEKKTHVASFYFLSATSRRLMARLRAISARLKSISSSFASCRRRSARSLAARARDTSISDGNSADSARILT